MRFQPQGDHVRQERLEDRERDLMGESHQQHHSSSHRHRHDSPQQQLRSVRRRRVLVEEGERDQADMEARIR